MKRELARTEKLDLNSSTDDLVSYMIAHFLLDQPQEVQRVMAKTAGRPDEFIATQVLATIQQYSGQYRLAAATVQRAAEQAARAKAPDAQAGFLLEDVTARGLAGICDSKDVVRQALSLDKSRQTQAFATLAAAVCSDGKVALPLASELIKKYPQDTLIQDVFGPLTKAFIALAAGRGRRRSMPQNRPNPITRIIQPRICRVSHTFSCTMPAMRSRVSNRHSGQLPGPSQTVFAPYVAQVQLGLARAYVMGGDKPAAKKAYEAFFVTWKDADADLPCSLRLRRNTPHSNIYKGEVLRRAIFIPLIVLTLCCSVVANRLTTRPCSTLGKEKRDILVQRIKDAKKDQDQTKQQLKTTMESFQALTGFQGGPSKRLTNVSTPITKAPTRRRASCTTRSSPLTR